MIKCLVCEGNDFYNAHGLYFCKICDTQTFDFLEQEELELDGQFNAEGFAANTQIVGARITQPSQSQRQPPATQEHNQTVLEQAKKASKEKSKGGRPFTTFEVFQLILSAQTNELIKLGFPASLRAKVFKIWCIYLSQLGEAFTHRKNYKLNTPHVRERDASRLTSAHSDFVGKRKMVEQVEDGDGETAQSTDVPLTEGTGEGYDSRYPPNKLNMNTLLCVLYIAISLVNPLYTLSDIIRWIKEGTIPYFNADNVLPQDMKFTRKDHNLLTHVVLPTHYGLRCLTANLARFLRLSNEDFIPVDIELLCIRYVLLLNLPGEVVSLTLTLVQSKKPSLTFTPHNANPRRTGVLIYEAVALSYIIIVLRDLFGFHNQLEQQLSEYANALEKDMPEDSRRLFNIDQWMQQRLMCREAITDLPQHNQDTQRLSSLKLALKSYSSIAPPLSRFAGSHGVMSQKINQEVLRKQLSTTLNQLSLGVRDLELQKQRKCNEDENIEENDDDHLSIVSSHHSTATFWSQPGVTSTQRQEEPPQPDDVTVNQQTDLEPDNCTDYSGHTLGYITNHRDFCNKHKLFTEPYSHPTIRSHVQMYVDDDHCDRVTKALMTSSNYSVFNKQDTGQSAGLQTLFRVCADSACITVKELADVYTVIEDTYICLQNNLPVDTLSSQYIYFPRSTTEQRRKVKWRQEEHDPFTIMRDSDLDVSEQTMIVEDSD